ncbi:hypothetical protein FHX08_000695 [Rhizobium sp. BK529]|uniref:hypothetical protein n=1 Tax=unclassified Rhizobium TaxID=2613769 RepID=UPI00104EB469|nr:MULTISPECIES: hypothetical protein [unclassified Rhizobium]MBB3590351.1 hypothetical protein [Rhizobium sp. BK529]TCS05044.1 hypothetical protein EV281_103725 [Rhizobium sp. BK418]
MKIRIVTLLACASLAACQTTAGKPSKDLKDYPEGVAYNDCLLSRAVAYAPQSGSPLELGLIAANSCSSSRQALLDAVSKNESPGFVRELSRRMERSQPLVAADMIIALRTKK